MINLYCLGSTTLVFQFQCCSHVLCCFKNGRNIQKKYVWHHWVVPLLAGTTSSWSWRAEVPRNRTLAFWGGGPWRRFGRSSSPTWGSVWRGGWRSSGLFGRRNYRYTVDRWWQQRLQIFRVSRGALRPHVPRPAGGHPGPAQGVPGPAGRRQHLRLPGDTAAPDSGRAAAAAAANNRQRQRRRRRRTPFWGNIRGRQRSWRSEKYLS